MVLPAMPRSFSIVSGLYTTNPGCISIAIFTPWSLAKCACLIQYGATFLSHCHARRSEYSGGQGVATQFGYLALSLSPGHPEKSITTDMPSFSARRTVFWLISRLAFATAGLGC